MIEILSILATWRLTNMFYAPEAGPFDLILHIRAALQRWHMTKKMLECDLCCSVWAAGFVALLYVLGKRWPVFHLIIRVFAWSGAVCLIRINMDAMWRVVNKYSGEE